MLELGNLIVSNFLCHSIASSVLCVLSVVEGVTQILETELDEAPEDEYGMAKLIQEKIIKVNGKHDRTNETMSSISSITITLDSADGPAGHRRPSLYWQKYGHRQH